MLDLGELGAAPQKVKLPDGQLYSIANPAELGILAQQRLISRYQRAKELMVKTDATEDDVAEMLSMLLDVAQTVVPDADRDLLGRLSLAQMDRLIRAFSPASLATARAEATTRRTSGT